MSEIGYNIVSTEEGAKRLGWTLEKAKKFKFLNIKGYVYPLNTSLGVSPRFITLLLHRVNTKQATNIVVTGEAGIGKSYFGIDIAQSIEGINPKTGRSNFTIDQVVFTFKEFMDLVLNLKTGKVILFDEPSYAMGKRDWYKELNKALVATMESFRFKVHPLIIPIINKNLLDKTVREHLIQFMVVMKKRGKGIAYRLTPSQFTEKIYYSEICELYRYHSFPCGKDSCLDCSNLTKKKQDRYVCNSFIAQYERKKAEIQNKRYKETMDLAETIETRRLTMEQIENLALNLEKRWLTEKGIDVQRLRVSLREEYGIRIGNNKGYELKAQIEMHYPELIKIIKN